MVKWEHNGGIHLIPKISDIFQKKLDEIQSRVPVKIRGSSYSVPFEKYLSDAVDKNSASSAGSDAVAEASDASKQTWSSEWTGC